ncbi:MAG TPA: ABC transporter permease [Candidatus Limnocylindrales bacterium]|nr:ABC transporter permease [Candidatus Limnocylindrales bacterium]
MTNAFRNERTKRLLRANVGVLAFLAIAVAFSIATPYFLTVGNLRNVLLQSAVTILIAVGAAIVILGGGIDLSVGSVVALASVVLGLLLRGGAPDVLAFLLAVLVGAACGAVSGTLVSFAGVVPFIATLGMLGICRGAALLATSGESISNLPSPLLLLLNGDVAGIPIPVAVAIGTVFLADIAMRATRWGRHLKATGGGSRSAWLSGVRVRRVLFGSYVASGAAAGIAACVLTSRLSSAQPIAGVMYELDAIGAVVIGGANLYGGRASTVRAAIGAVVLTMIRNGLTLLNVTPYAYQAVVGAIVILAVLGDRRPQPAQT